VGVPIFPGPRPAQEIVMGKSPRDAFPPAPCSPELNEKRHRPEPCRKPDCGERRHCRLTLPRMPAHRRRGPQRGRLRALGPRPALSARRMRRFRGRPFPWRDSALASAGAISLADTARLLRNIAQCHAGRVAAGRGRPWAALLGTR